MTITSATSQIDQLNAGAALERAVAHLQSRQHADGWWKGALDTNVTMDAEDLLLREFLGIRGERETRMAATWIRSQQRDDGSWGNFHGADGDLSTTVEAYAARQRESDRLTWHVAIWVGLGQILAAVFPGTSRSAACARLQRWRRRSRSCASPA